MSQIVNPFEISKIVKIILKLYFILVIIIKPYILIYKINTILLKVLVES
jgi:hypothetical protein